MSSTKKQIRKYGTYVEKKVINDKKRKIVISIRNLMEEEKYSLAFINIENYISDYGYDCYIIHELGKYYEIQNEYNKAKEYFNKNVLNNCQNMYYSLYEIAKIQKIEGNNEEAIKNLIKIINSKHKDKSHAYLELAKNYMELEKYKEAEQILKDIIEKFDNPIIKAGAYEFYIETLLENKKIDEVEKIINEMPIKIDLEYTKAIIETQKGNLKEAKNIYTNILRNTKKNHKKATYNLAKIEMQLYNFDSAINLTDELLREKKYRYTDSLRLKIECLIKSGAYSEAYLAINKLVSISNSYIDFANFYYAKIEFYKGNYDEALSLFKTIKKDNIVIKREAIFKEICIYIKQNKYNDAWEKYEELKKYDYTKKFENEYGLIEIYLGKKLHKKINVKKERYVEKQMLNYSYNRAIKHIEKHLEDDTKKDNHTKFNDNIDIKKMYSYAVANLSEEAYSSNNICDSYILKYEGVGVDESGVLDYIKVITLPNSKKIITIYPFNNYKEKNKKSKIKIMSRIDKFKHKYNM